MKRVFINPGWGRTATTTLHEELYGKHSEILHIGRPWNNLTSAFVTELKRNCINYDQQLVASMIKKMDKGDDKAYVLCDENILDGISLQPNSSIICTYANRMKELFVNPHIVLVLRNQITWLESFYSNGGRVLKDLPDPFNGRHVEIDSWLEWQWKECNSERSFINHINYNKYVNMFIEVFGENNVHIFLFEDFVHQKKYFVEKLSSLMDINKKEALDLVTGKHSNKQQPNKMFIYMKLREKILPGVRLNKIIPGGGG